MTENSHAVDRISALIPIHEEKIINKLITLHKTGIEIQDPSYENRMKMISKTITCRWKER